MEHLFRHGQAGQKRISSPNTHPHIHKSVAVEAIARPHIDGYEKREPSVFLMDGRYKYNSPIFLAKIENVNNSDGGNSR